MHERGWQNGSHHDCHLQWFSCSPSNRNCGWSAFTSTWNLCIKNHRRETPLEYSPPTVRVCVLELLSQHIATES